MAITLTDIPEELNDALRSRAEAQGKDVDEVILDFIHAGLAMAGSSPQPRDLSEFAGSWISDPAVEAAIKEQDRIDPEMWR